MTTNHETDVGASLDMGTYTIVSDDLDGSKARLRIGKDGQPALIELFSDVAVSAPALFDWQVADGVGTLRIDLTQAQLAALGGKGKWDYWIHVITQSGQVVPVAGGTGTVYVRGVALAKAG